MKKILFLVPVLAIGVAACTSDSSSNGGGAKLVTPIGTPVITASAASPTTNETVTFSIGVTGGALQNGLLVWSDNCRGEFYSQSGTQVTWQNKWAEDCEIKAELYANDPSAAATAGTDATMASAFTAPAATSVTDITTKYEKGTLITLAGSSCRQRETWNADNPMVDEGIDAEKAAFGMLGGIAVSKTGEIYFTDRQGGRVLKIDTAGKLRRVAGVVAGNYSNDTGDGGKALDATLYWPYDVALDSKGDIYVSSAWGYRVRKIYASSGTIATYAGNGSYGNPGNGALAASTPVRPLFLSFDSSDNLYIGSAYADAVYKVYASTNTIFTLPGSYNYVFGVDWSPTGLYIAERYNYRVSKFDGSTNVAFAGTGTSGFSGDGGAATSAAVSQPYGVVVGSDGTVYVGDTYNAVIRAVTSNGKIATVIGPGRNTLPGDGGVASGTFINPSDMEIDANGDMIIADRLACQIKKVVGPW